MRSLTRLINTYIDSDTSARYSQGCADIVNIEYDSKGVCRNPLGNAEPTFDYGSGLEAFDLTNHKGTLKIVGSTSSDKYIYYFLQVTGYVPPDPMTDVNVLGDAILEYNTQTHEIRYVLVEYITDYQRVISGTNTTFDATGEFLNFADHINNPRVVNGLLYWVDEINRPRKVNIEKGVNYNIGIMSSDTLYTIVQNRIDSPDPTDPLLDPKLIGVYSEKRPIRYYFYYNIQPTPYYLFDIAFWYSYDGGNTIEGYTVIQSDSAYPVANTMLSIGNGLSIFFDNVNCTNRDGYNEWQIDIVPLNTYTDITSDTITVIKKPPVYPPQDCVYNTDQSIKKNNLQTRLFKFAYRYIYEDYELSRFSPISKVPLPFDEDNFLGDFKPDVSYNNTINFSIDTGDSDVKKIEIYANENDSIVWFEVDTLDKNELLLDNNTTTGITFRNDKRGAEIEAVDVFYQFDYVPEIARTQELISDDKLLYADITEGFNKAYPEVSLSYINTKVISGNVRKLCNTFWEDYWYPNPDTEKDSSTSGITTTTHVKRFISIKFPELAELGDISGVGKDLVLELQLADLSKKTYTIRITTATAVNYPVQFIEDFRDLINNDPSISGTFGVTAKYYKYTGYANTTFRVPRYMLLLKHNEYDNVFNYISDKNINKINVWKNGILKIADTVNDKHTTWKRGATQKFGIVYKDAWAKTIGVVRDDNMEITIHPYVNLLIAANSIYANGITDISVLGTTHYKADIQYSIYNTPPPEATTYEIVLQPQANISDFIIFAPDAYNYDPGDTTKENTQLVSLGTRSCYSIGINRAITEINTNNPKSSLSVWSWAKGDRLRIVSHWDGTKYLPFSDVIDLPIVGIKEVNGIEEPLIDRDNLTDVTMQDVLYLHDCIFECYRPNTTTSDENTTWLTCGEVYPIIDAGLDTRRHGRGDNLYVDGNLIYTSQDQDIVNNIPATGNINSGDAYIYQRLSNAVASLYEIVESKQFSDYYDSNVFDWGKPYAVLPNAKQERLKSGMRSSNQIIPNTFTNGLSTFDYIDYSYLLDGDGSITSLRQVGDVLTVLQERKATSFYIGKDVLRSGTINGTDIVSMLNETMGARSPSVYNYGCTNPESVSVAQGNIYFWDGYNGQWIRKAGNGMQPISNNAMSVFWNNVKNRIGTNVVSVHSAFDQYRDKLLITVSAPTSETWLPEYNFTIGFWESLNLWKSRYSFVPEHYGNLGSTLVSFKDGKLYLHDSGVSNTFYGTHYSSEIDLYHNTNSDQIKVYNAMEIDTDSPDWICDPIQSSNGVLSKILKWVEKEFHLYSPFKKNINTKNSKSDLWNLANGDDVRANYIQYKLTNASTDNFEIGGIEIDFTPSKV